MKTNEEMVKLGSMTAKNGFKTEKEIADKFNNWICDDDAKLWLQIMNYDLNEIEFVKATVLRGYKSDVNVQISIKLKEAIDIENLQVKLVSNIKGFNQIDKRWVDNYANLWQIPENIKTLLKHFTGELPPKIENPKDSRRMFINEFHLQEQNEIIKFFDDNKVLIVNDIIRGRGRFAAGWVLVAQKVSVNARWVLKSINEVISHYFGDGIVKISPQGSLRLGNITIQRKGGDGSRPTANMLQFKIDPSGLFDD